MSDPDRIEASLLTPDRLDRPFGDEHVERLFPVLSGGMDWGLDRTRAALRDLDHPERSFRSIHVGGTNGKGSVASTVAAVLGAAGHRVGLYTSPHLVRLNERFQVAGRPLGDADLHARAVEVREVVARRELTFFEAATVLAFHAFRESAVDVAVVEVGLGGRLDATNVLHPVCSAITNIAMDHAAYLGTTLEEIAGEKAGIIKPGVPVVTAEWQPALLEVVRQVAAARGAPFRALDPLADLHHLEIEIDHTTFTLETDRWGSLRLRTPLVGRHQALNAALAIEALACLPPGLVPDGDALRVGVEGVRWPGRVQIERTPEGVWLFDVAHNPAGVLSLIDVLDRLALPGPLVALVGVLGDKDWRAMLPPLFRRVDRVILTCAPSAPRGRSWNPHAAASDVGAELADAERPRIEEDFDGALTLARSVAGQGTVVVTGSAYTVGSALERLGREPFPDGA